MRWDLGVSFYDTQSLVLVPVPDRVRVVLQFEDAELP